MENKENYSVEEVERRIAEALVFERAFSDAQRITKGVGEAAGACSYAIRKYPSSLPSSVKDAVRVAYQSLGGTYQDAWMDDDDRGTNLRKFIRESWLGEIVEEDGTSDKIIRRAIANNPFTRAIYDLD